LPCERHVRCRHYWDSCEIHTIMLPTISQLSGLWSRERGWGLLRMFAPGRVMEGRRLLGQIIGAQQWRILHKHALVTCTARSLSYRRRYPPTAGRPIRQRLVQQRRGAHQQACYCHSRHDATSSIDWSFSIFLSGLTLYTQPFLCKPILCFKHLWQTRHLDLTAVSALGVPTSWSLGIRRHRYTETVENC
jgi:hypothetical protein